MDLWPLLMLLDNMVHPPPLSKHHLINSPTNCSVCPTTIFNCVVKRNVIILVLTSAVSLTLTTLYPIIVGMET